MEYLLWFPGDLLSQGPVQVACVHYAAILFLGFICIVFPSTILIFQVEIKKMLYEYKYKISMKHQYETNVWVPFLSNSHVPTQSNQTVGLT